MRWTTHLLVALAAFALAGAAKAQSLQDFRWLTEEYAPYNYTEDGALKGIAVDILVAMWDRLGIEREVSDIQVLPWARGYRMAQERPGHCLFSTTVTDSRRELFAFVEPIVDTRVAIVAPRGALEVDSPTALRDVPVGVVREDIGELLLQEAGVDKRLSRTDSARSLVRMLDAGRFAAISYSLDTVWWNMKAAGIDTAKYENVLTLTESVLGFACHKDTDPALLARLQGALDALREDGTLARIRARYVD
ncbi:substrate-binding periplasmic protein [Pseudazoarcus pumilus]|uniref:ABC transporter substrate-binding protein n=1 Tax=Pseudazoarcus pumilus TaxID=2067960 RepID=A0A2I6S9P2_9RHOO|nr:transporter substrate-binding domain-containing protein [Pseudazoarcus pumilus]AUN95957.1 ABC transporter substrate-binding protein [Pseudazoarcus pumilus]